MVIRDRYNAVHFLVLVNSVIAKTNIKRTEKNSNMKKPFLNGRRKRKKL